MGNCKGKKKSCAKNPDRFGERMYEKTLKMHYLFRQLAFLFVLLSCSSLHAETYTTIGSGNWTDVVSVWSTDGTTPCGCTPGLLTNNDTIIINHDISANANVDLTNGTLLQVNSGGSYTSAFVLSLANSSGIVEGNVSVKKFTLDSGSTVDFSSSILTVTSRIEVYGTINVDGGYFLMTGGNLNIYPGAEFNMTNAAKVDVQNGNISNEGTIDICSTCCFTTTGNWTNESSGSVQGGGAATTTSGNMKNFGSWSFTVVWCSAGASTGMPLFENCATANAICSIIVLPVEFGEIHAEVEGVPQVYWSTISERDNDYFNVLHTSGDGMWEIVGTVKGAGNSTETRFYSFADTSTKPGTHYYRVQQVDYNGAASNSDIVGVTFHPQQATLYPNPVDRNGTLFIGNTDGAVQVDLLDLTGKMIATIPIHNDDTALSLSEHPVTSGVYLLQITYEGRQETQRIVVR